MQYKPRTDIQSHLLISTHTNEYTHILIFYVYLSLKKENTIYKEVLTIRAVCGISTVVLTSLPLASLQLVYIFMFLSS